MGDWHELPILSKEMRYPYKTVFTFLILKRGLNQKQPDFKVISFIVLINKWLFKFLIHKKMDLLGWLFSFLSSDLSLGQTSLQLHTWPRRDLPLQNLLVVTVPGMTILQSMRFDKANSSSKNIYSLQVRLLFQSNFPSDTWKKGIVWVFRLGKSVWCNYFFTKATGLCSVVITVLPGASLHLCTATLAEGWWEEGLLSLTLWTWKKIFYRYLAVEKAPSSLLTQPSVIQFSCFQ